MPNRAIEAVTYSIPTIQMRPIIPDQPTTPWAFESLVPLPRILEQHVRVVLNMPTSSNDTEYVPPVTAELPLPGYENPNLNLDDLTVDDILVPSPLRAPALNLARNISAGGSSLPLQLEDVQIEAGSNNFMVSEENCQVFNHLIDIGDEPPEGMAPEPSTCIVEGVLFGDDMPDTVTPMLKGCLLIRPPYGFADDMIRSLEDDEPLEGTAPERYSFAGKDVQSANEMANTLDPKLRLHLEARAQQDRIFQANLEHLKVQSTHNLTIDPKKRDEIVRYYNLKVFLARSCHSTKDYYGSHQYHDTQTISPAKTNIKQSNPTPNEGLVTNTSQAVAKINNSAVTAITHCKLMIDPKHRDAIVRLFNETVFTQVESGKEHYYKSTRYHDLEENVEEDSSPQNGRGES